MNVANEFPPTLPSEWMSRSPEAILAPPKAGGSSEILKQVLDRYRRLPRHSSQLAVDLLSQQFEAGLDRGSNMRTRKM